MESRGNLLNDQQRDDFREGDLFQFIYNHLVLMTKVKRNKVIPTKASTI